MECAVENVQYSASHDFFLLSIRYGGSAEPGQFFRLKTTIGPYVARPFSVYDLEDGVLKFLVKSGGEFEHFFKNSSSLLIDGPLGNPIPSLENPLLVAGGAGYAPIHFYAMKHKAEIVVGARNEDFFDLVDVPSSSVCTIEPTTTLDVAKFSPLENVVACGPLPMLEVANEMFKDRNLYLVLEEKMACGRGMCEGCAVMTKDGIKFVCKDGPTFPAKEVNLNWTR